MDINVTPEVEALLAAGAPVAIGVSGGKDSCAVALALVPWLRARQHRGEIILIHSDLGSVEWQDSLPTCQRLAKHLNTELIVVRRKAGGLMERWESRWASSVRRYANLECVKLILPWSTASMRLCTSELKTDVICSALKKRWPGKKILSVTGVRAEESANRAKAPIIQLQPKLTTLKTQGFNWNAILDWKIGDVWARMEQHGFEPHEAYRVYGASRVSCVYCILATAKDLMAGTLPPANHNIYRRMCDLELDSTFAFRETNWLCDLRPDLLSRQQQVRIPDAKRKACRRQELEAGIPKHLLYTKGWPTCLPTGEEAEMLAEIRREIGGLLAIPVRYTTKDQVLGRYRELMSLKESKA